MDSRGEIGPGQVEWLDLGPAEPPEGDQPRRRNGRPWYLLAAALAVTGILVAALNHDSKRTTASPSHVPSTIATETAVAPSSAEASPTASPSVAVTNLGHRLLDVPLDWELFARGPDSVVRIELARGRVTSTVVPSLQSGGGVSFVVGPDRVIIRPLDPGDAYEVRDGHPAQDVPAVFGLHGPVLPGADRNHLWATTDSGGHTVMRLVGFDGRPTGASITIPDNVQAASDGVGYLTFYGTGGVYDARPDGVRRITTGALLATGPTHWLTEECAPQFRCATTVIDRVSGTRHTLAASNGNYSFGGFVDGVIAPDGSVAALVRDDGQEGRLKVQMLDLANGDLHDTSVLLNPDTAFNGGGMFAWTPNSRWLFIAAQAGRLLVLDRRTMRVTELLRSLPLLNQVGLRTG